MEIAIVSILLLISIVLILAEIFFLPGITFAAVGGAAFGIGGIAYAYVELGPTGGTIAVVCAGVIFCIAFLLLVRSKTLNKIALTTDIDSTVAGENRIAEQIKEGDSGITISRLNPIGKVRVNDLTVEAKSMGEFIDEETEVVVRKITPTQITVTIK